MIFSRKRRSQASSTVRTEGDSGVAEQPGLAEPAAADPSTAQRPAAEQPPSSEPLAGDTGPYDSAQAPSEIPVIDLGSLRIPPMDGVDLRVQADPEGNIQQVVLVSGESALQLGAFAAPRTESVWDEAREQLRAQLRADGFTSSEEPGEYGPELRARVRTPDGMTELRFVGISGPRWLLRAVFQGAAAVDPQASVPLRECLRGVIVHRGGEALPVHEALPLRLPKEIAERAAAGRAEREAAETSAAQRSAAAQAAAEGLGGLGQRRRPQRNR